MRSYQILFPISGSSLIYNALTRELFHRTKAQLSRIDTLTSLQFITNIQTCRHLNGNRCP